MEEKKIANLNELLNAIEHEKKELEILNYNFKYRLKGKPRGFVSIKDYIEQLKLYKIRMNEMKEKIKFKKLSINKLEDYLNNLCTFDYDVATKFIADALSIIEGEEYQATDLELSHMKFNTTIYVTTNIPVSQTYGEDVCLISTTKNTNLICDMYKKGKLEDSDDVQNSIEDNKYILLEKDKTYTMFDYFEQKVPEELTETYHYLSEIIIDLINFRLSNQYLTDSEVVSIMLQQIPEKYSKLIGNKRSK